MAAPAHELEIEPAQRFAVVADDGAELDVEIEIQLLGLGFFRHHAGQRGLHEIGSVEDVAAHRHAQRAVAAAVGLERGLVALRQAEHREIRRHDVARAVEFDRAFHVRARTGDGEIVDMHGLACLEHRIGGVRRLAGRLHPTRQQVVDLHRCQIGIHGHRGVLAVIADARREPDRNSAGDGGAEIDAEPAARGFVDHRLQPQFGVGGALLLVRSMVAGVPLILTSPVTS